MLAFNSRRACSNRNIMLTHIKRSFSLPCGQLTRNRQVNVSKVATERKGKEHYRQILHSNL